MIFLSFSSNDFLFVQVRHPEVSGHPSLHDGPNSPNDSYNANFGDLEKGQAAYAGAKQCTEAPEINLAPKHVKHKPAQGWTPDRGQGRAHTALPHAPQSNPAILVTHHVYQGSRT